MLRFVKLMHSKVHFLMYLHDACWQAVNKFQGEMMYALCMKEKGKWFSRNPSDPILS